MRESRADGKPVCSVIVQRNNKNDSNYSDPSLYIRTDSGETLIFVRNAVISISRDDNQKNFAAETIVQK